MTKYINPNRVTPTVSPYHVTGVQDAPMNQTATPMTPRVEIGESLGHCHECGCEYIRTLADEYSALCFDCSPAPRVSAYATLARVRS